MDTAVGGAGEPFEAGAGFHVHDDLRLGRVTGVDARSWLNDLVTADVATLEPHATRRTLLLTPTGRIRADLHLFADEDGTFLLVQRSDQPEAMVEALRPYVLSSSVEVEDVDRVVVTVFAPTVATETTWRPTLEGGDGSDALVARSDLTGLRERLESAGLVEVSAEALERRRILRGIPRFGRDFGPDSLPAEAGLDALIDTEKGCFLGQESVAKVRNLGHPPRVLRHVSCRGAVIAGADVLAAGEAVGTITSAMHRDDRDDSVMIARVRWNAAPSELTLRDGTPLSVFR